MVAHVMMRILPEDLPEQGLKVRYRYGECFGTDVEWGEISSGVLIAQERANDHQESGLNLQDLGSEGYAGFESRTGTYWRYQQDSDPEVFREFCMQIIDIEEDFKPHSAWAAWEVLGYQCSPKRLYVALKNRVTGTHLIYRIQDKGLGYQFKDLGGGRRVQKMIKHDYLFNRLLGTAFRKLDHQKLKTSTTESEEKGSAQLGMELTFERDGLVFKYQINEVDFSLGIFAATESGLELLRMLELPHSSLVEDSRELLG